LFRSCTLDSALRRRSVDRQVPRCTAMTSATSLSSSLMLSHAADAASFQPSRLSLAASSLPCSPVAKWRSLGRLRVRILSLLCLCAFCLSLPLPSFSAFSLCFQQSPSGGAWGDCLPKPPLPLPFSPLAYSIPLVPSDLVCRWLQPLSRALAPHTKPLTQALAYPSLSSRLLTYCGCAGRWKPTNSRLSNSAFSDKPMRSYRNMRSSCKH